MRWQLENGGHQRTLRGAAASNQALEDIPKAHVHDDAASHPARNGATKSSSSVFRSG